MLSAQLISTDEAFESLGPEWQELIDAIPHTSYFQTWEFTHLRWTHFRGNRRLWVLTIRDGAGKLVGIAPFAIGEGQLGRVPVKRLEFICRVEIPFRFERYYLDGEDLDLIALPELRDAVDALVTCAMERDASQWDVIDLGWLSSESSLIESLNNGKKVVRRETPRARVALPTSWEAYNSGILDRGLSRQNAYKARRLERDFPGRVVYRLVERRDEVEPAIDNLEDLKLIQFAARGMDLHGDDPHAREHRAFARDFGLAACDRGWLRFHQLLVDGEVIAANFGIAFNGVYYLLNKGYNPKWKKHSPGYVLQAHEIEQAISEGLRGYDLGQGLITDKTMWTQSVETDVRLISGATLKGRGYVNAEAAWSTARVKGPEIVRRIVPEDTYVQMKRSFNEFARSLGR